VTLVGSVLSSLGFLLTAFSQSLEVVYFTCGILAGFGLSLNYVAALVIVAYYFDTKRSLATGIAVCGSGIGTLVFAPFIEYLISYYGWRGAMIILSGCFLNMAVCGMFFRDLEWTKSIHKRKKKAASKNRLSPESNENAVGSSSSPAKSLGNVSNASSRGGGAGTPMMPELEELKALLRNGDVTALFDNLDAAAAANNHESGAAANGGSIEGGQSSERMSSSLVHLPTYLMTSLGGEINSPMTSLEVNQNVINAICENEMAKKFFLEKYPESAIARSFSSCEVEEDEGCCGGSNVCQNPDPVINGNGEVSDGNVGSASGVTSGGVGGKTGKTKLKRKVSSIFKRTASNSNSLKPILKKPRASFPVVTSAAADNDAGVGHPQEQPLIGAGSSCGSGNVRNNSCTSRTRYSKLAAQQESHHSMNLKHLKLRRQSLTYRCAMLSITRYRLRACNSCPDIYRNSVINIPKETEEEEDMMTSSINSHRMAVTSSVKSFFLKYCFCLESLAVWRKFLDLSFSLFLLSNFILYAWYDVMYTFLPDYAEKTLQWQANDVTVLLPLIGIFNTLGEIVVGYVGDKNWINLNYLYAVCMAACGACTCLVPLMSGRYALRTLAAVFGFAISANYSLTSPILVDLVSIEDFSSAYGFLLLVQGVSNLVGPSFAGHLYDVTGQWHLTFGVGGAFIVFSGLLLVVVPLVRACLCCRRRKKAAESEGQQEDVERSEVKDTKVIVVNGNAASNDMNV